MRFGPLKPKLYTVSKIPLKMCHFFAKKIHIEIQIIHTVWTNFRNFEVFWTYVFVVLAHCVYDFGHFYVLRTLVKKDEDFVPLSPKQEFFFFSAARSAISRIAGIDKNVNDRVNKHGRNPN